MAHGYKPVPIADLLPAEIDPLFTAQAGEWLSTLLWDFRRISQRMLFLAELRALAGFALLNGDGRAVGYACYTIHGRCAEVSDFYVEPAFRCIGANTRLLVHVLKHLLPGIEQITMAPAIPHKVEINALPRLPVVYPRAAEAACVSQGCLGYKGSRSNAVAIRPWDEAYKDEAVEMIPSAYSGHVEAEITGFSRSLSAARDFLDSIIHVQPSFPFLQEASVAAVHSHSGKLCGFLLASQAAPGVAHANLLCVAPWAAAYGLGNRLSGEHFLALDRIGYHTVTARFGTSDPRLNRFYGRLGFVRQCDQTVYAWGQS